MMNDYLCTGTGRSRPESEGCCRPEPPCPPQPPAPCPNDDDGCACRRGFVQTLQMLLRTELSNLVDFQSFAFVTPEYLVGAALIAPEIFAAAYDNLSDPLVGTFSRFSPGNCDDISVAGVVELPDYGAPPTGLTASRIDLCDLVAVVFEPAGETEEEETENYQAARTLLRTLLQPGRRPRPPFPPGPDFPPYPDPCDCCCAPQNNAGGSISLLAGSLLVANATVLGSLDGVMVLANDSAERFYFVCENDAVIIR